MTRIKIIVRIVAIVTFFAGVSDSFAAGGGEGRIFRGTNATEGEFPYIAALRNLGDNNPETGYFCTGSILTANWILTSAQCCVRLPSWVEAYVGSIHLTKGGKGYIAKKMIQHERYYRFRAFDICVIQLETPLELGEKVQQVTLPPPDFQLEYGDSVTIASWGRLENERTPDTLQKGVGYALTECQSIVHDVTICLIHSKPGHAPYKRDTGGIAIKKGVQIGIASRGSHPERHLPCMYTNVSYLIDWIKEKLEDDASQLKFY